MNEPRVVLVPDRKEAGRCETRGGEERARRGAASAEAVRGQDPVGPHGLHSGWCGCRQARGDQSGTARMCGAQRSPRAVSGDGFSTTWSEAWCLL